MCTTQVLGYYSVDVSTRARLVRSHTSRHRWEVAHSVVQPFESDKYLGFDTRLHTN